MPWTTAPPTYRSIPSLSLSASPSESALATSLQPRGSVRSPPARAGRNLSREVAVERAPRAATGPGRQEESGRAPRRGIALSRGLRPDQHLSACGRACPAARSCQAPPAPRTLGVRGPRCSRPNPRAAKSSRLVLANFFRAHVLTKQPGSLPEPGMERRA